MWIIQNNTEKTKKHLPVFYKQFKAEKAVEKCLLSVSALGIFSIKINGVEIDDYFMPGWTNYNQYVHLCHYDITRYLQEDNLLEITLADGWYAGRLGYTKEAKIYGEQTALFAKLQLRYLDGSELGLETDGSWRVGDSKIVCSSFFDGETVDFRTPRVDVQTLPFASEYAMQIPLEEYAYQPVKKVGELIPKVMYQDEKVIRLDFGQNFAGFITLIAEGEAGVEILLKHAEILTDDGELYYENLRSVEATDRLILSGGKDFFDPKFTFHGFRYAEIFLGGKAKISQIKGVALSQQLEYHGRFSCSDPIVNAIFQNTLWGQKGNFISIPTDCPQRDERLGWTGDAEVFCNSAMFNSDCDAFFDNYLKLIRTDILPDGKIPSFVPFFIPVSDSTAGVPGWADAICVIPYTHYLHYGRADVLRENLPYAEKHVEYYLRNSEQYRLNVINTFGDWLSVERADDVDSISQCFFGLSAMLVSKMAGVLGETEKAERYMEIYRGAKEAFRRDYIAADGKLAGDSQTIYAFALSVGYVTVEEVKAHFLASIQRAGGKLTTGFIGVKYLLPALCEIGETELAYRLIRETEYPSWGYTILNGATTIWERWNGYTKEHGFETPTMNSFNHYSLGSCVEWLYSHVLGIKLSLDGSISISPSLSKQLAFAEGEYKTRKGKISIAWKYKDEKFYFTVEADSNVVYTYDFSDREIVSLQRHGNSLCAILK